MVRASVADSQIRVVPDILVRNVGASAADPQIRVVSDILIRIVRAMRRIRKLEWFLLTLLYQLRSGSGMNIPDLISKSLETIFLALLLTLLPPGRSVHLANSVLRIRKVTRGSDFFSIPDPGSDFFPSRILDSNFFHPGSASKN